MSLFILTETSAGLALFKATDKRLLRSDDILQRAQASDAGVADMFRLRKFSGFTDAVEAVEEVASVVDGKVTAKLIKLLEPLKDESKVTLAVADAKIASAIKKLPQFDITPVHDSATSDVFRLLRENIHELIPQLAPDHHAQTTLGLSHSVSRHKLRFSADNIDNMIVHAVSLLDDLEKDVNFHAMRVKEWYGWHFPEMAKIINDNLAYAKVALKVGHRQNANSTDLSDILPEEIEVAIKRAAEMSMGTDFTEDDMNHLQKLARLSVGKAEHRELLGEYLASRMRAIAPNLTALVGELVGARLIAKAGNLTSLAKSPASTIQILGAEKALFRALKTKHDTPKYGILYHASLVGQATGRNKGKIARMLATKTALGLRVDALSEQSVVDGVADAEQDSEQRAEMGNQYRAAIERRLRFLEGKPLRPAGVNIGPDGQTQPGKWELKEARRYNKDADAISEDAPAEVNGDGKKGKKDKKSKKLIQEVEPQDTEMADTAAGVAEDSSDEDATMTNGATNGVNGSGKLSKEEKKREKEEHAARKAERKAKKAAKEAKKAEKEAKRAAEAADTGAKRKHDGDVDDEASGEKKKKKKKHSTA